MKILVDTPIWSLAFRHKKNSSMDNMNTTHINELTELVGNNQVVLIGPVRQEVLSGISNLKQFNLLRKKLSAFDNPTIGLSEYELAAELFNKCRKNGIQGSHIDFLICSISIINKYKIYTTDNDFLNYSKIIDIELYDFNLNNLG